MTEDVTVDRRIEAPPEIVFSYLVDPTRFVLWMGVEASLDPTPGGGLRVKLPGGQIAVGTYQLVDPPNRVVFSFGWDGDTDVPPGSSTVEVILQRDGDGTRLRLRHFDLPDDSSRQSHGKGWNYHLDGLATAVAGTAGG